MVDDESDLVFVLTQRLESEGYRVITACDGRECIRKLNEKKPGIIILDLIMPVMDGFEAYKEIRRNSQNKNIPMIVVTAVEEMKEAIALKGVSDYIVKPFNGDELLLRIKDILQE